MNELCIAHMYKPVVFVLTIIVPLATDAHGYNRHVWDNSLETNVTRRKYALVIMTLFSFASGTLRISVLLFYRRLSQRLISPIFKTSLWITLGLAGVIGIVYSLKPLFACRPISAFWDQVDVNKLRAGYTYKCFDEGIDILTASAISAVQDLITALLPNILLWRLQSKRTQKVMLVALFSLAYSTAALGFIRVGFNYRVYYESYDVTWNAWTSWLLTMLELQLAAYCACAPAMKTFLAHYGILERLWRLSTVNSSKRSEYDHKQSSDQGVSGKVSSGHYEDTQPLHTSIAGSKQNSEDKYHHSTKVELQENLSVLKLDKQSKAYGASQFYRSSATLRSQELGGSSATNRDFI